ARRARHVARPRRLRAALRARLRPAHLRRHPGRGDGLAARPRRVPRRRRRRDGRDGGGVMSDSTNGGARPHALELENVTAGYGRTVVLRDVDISVPAGSVAALIGPNGAGKTTLLRTASGLLRATSGAVRVSGAEVTRRRPHERARAGLCLVP